VGCSRAGDASALGMGVVWTQSLADLQHPTRLKVAKRRSVEWEGGCERRIKACQIPLIYNVGFCCVESLSALLLQFPEPFAVTPFCTAENHLSKLSKLMSIFS